MKWLKGCAWVLFAGAALSIIFAVVVVAANCYTLDKSLRSDFATQTAVAAPGVPVPQGDDATCPGILAAPAPKRVSDVEHCLDWFYQAPVAMRPFVEPPAELWSDACARHYASKVEGSVRAGKSPC